MNAVETHFPEFEIRFCCMHLYINMKKEFKGLGVCRQMWLAARSTTDYFFNMNMVNLKNVKFHDSTSPSNALNFCNS